MLSISDVKQNVSEHTTPKSTIVKGVAYGGAWYTGAVIYTYSQPALVHLLRQATIAAAGPALGSTLGAGIVAPALVPLVVPTLAVVGATATWYGITAIGNIAQKAIFGEKKAKG